MKLNGLQHLNIRCAVNDLPYVHIGIVVRDLEAAVERFSLLGLTFRHPWLVFVWPWAPTDHGAECTKTPL